MLRVFLDTCVFDWILDNPRGNDLLACLEAGDIEVVVFPEVSKEVHNVPDTKAERRDRLFTVLRRFFPVHSAHVSVSGLARAGAMRSTTSQAAGLRERLRQMGFSKLDALHLINAALEGCQVFLTSDKEDIIKRRGTLELLLGLRFLWPHEFLAIDWKHAVAAGRDRP